MSGSDIVLSLVSHTNAGKTTLARTLLASDIGEVRDAPHVTEFAEEHELLALPGGERLMLWDTPGFGDTARLARRLRGSERPLGWFLTQVWDRVADRPFWSTQQALRHVRERSDLVLYLVNAAESPAAAGYVEPEMELLAWIGKPVIVLLNQLGEPRPAALERDELRRWREHLAQGSGAVTVLPMDAFARCWVQELTLLNAVTRALDGDRRQVMKGLAQAWRQRREAQFEAAIELLAASMGRLAAARHPVAQTGLFDDAVRRLGRALRVPRAGDDPATAAQQALGAALDEDVRRSTDELIRLHGLRGEAAPEVLKRVAEHFETRLPLPEGRAAVFGGLLSGALAGLKADVASGGLTLGGGLLAGGVLGAIAGAGAARAVNLMRGLEQGVVGWADAALTPMVEASLLRYLAVAHFGRGRGDWALGESPPHWRELVHLVLQDRRDDWDELWLERHGAEAMAQAIRPLLLDAARQVLARLYPGTAEATAAYDHAP